MRKMTHPALVARVGRTTIFARVDPDQKLQIVRAVHESGHVVGYMGDGINDAPALHVADVGISVDNATDVARSAADIILLEPSLEAISRGVVEGRRTFANTLKYIRMGTSSNFGNMLSMAGAALLLRSFLPMTPGQILLNNLIYDASQTAIPTDHVDPEVEAVPARWDVHSIERFMILFGPISSIFDYATFGLLLLMLGQNEKSFHTGWFVESLFTQILVVLAIRTRMSPFWRSRPSRELAVAIFAALVMAPARVGTGLWTSSDRLLAPARGDRGRVLDHGRDREADLRQSRSGAYRRGRRRPSAGRDPSSGRG
jgi:Mg2+-importing ATPase